jgi:MoxR-like ATPase
MNPCYLDQGLPDSYEGSEPLDQALADRFAFIIQVPDWNELEETNQRAIADPRGEGLLSDDDGKIRGLVEEWSRTYQELVQDPPQKVIEYCRVAATVLNEAKIRISPRRVRQLVKNILGVLAVSGGEIEEKKLLLTLRWSLPHRAWGVIPKEEHIKAAHRVAWDAFFLKGKEEWLHDFHLRRGLAGKVRKLINDCPDSDTGTLAVTQLLANESRERAAAFAFATYPLALKGKLPIGKEGINELGKLAKKLMEINGEIEWQERNNEKNTQHPEYSRFSKVLAKLSGGRRERATQLFYYLLVNDVPLSNPEAYEEEFEKCISLLRTRV